MSVLMLAAGSSPTWLVVVLPVVGTLLGVLIGQLVPEFLHRRRAVRDRYDAAITAVAQARSTQYGVGLGIPAAFLKTTTETEHSKAEQELSMEAVKRWLKAVAEARSALAALHPWSPDLQRFWADRFVDENDFDGLMKLLYERRERPLTRYDEKGRQVTAI